VEAPHRSLRIRTVSIPRCTTGLTRARYIAMPPILYLDANVYDHMVKGYIPQAEVNGLRAALRAGRLTRHC